MLLDVYGLSSLVPVPLLYYNGSETSKTVRIWVLPNILLATIARLRVAGMLNSFRLPTVCDR